MTVRFFIQGDKMKKSKILIAIAVTFIAASSCVRAADVKPAQGEGPKRQIVTVTDVITDAKNYVNKKIVLVGMFMGIDGRCAKPAPKKNDWMMQDGNGKCVWARGMFPEGCSAVSKLGVGKDVAVEGVIILDGEKPVFVSNRAQAVSVEAKKKQDEQNKAKIEASKKKLYERLQKEYAQTIYNVGDIALNPAAYPEAGMQVKGLYYDDKGHCKGQPPVAASDWMFEDLNGNCIFVHGPKPLLDGKPLEPGSLFTIDASVRKKEVGNKVVYYLEDAAAKNTSQKNKN